MNNNGNMISRMLVNRGLFRDSSSYSDRYSDMDRSGIEHSIGILEQNRKLMVESIRELEEMETQVQNVDELLEWTNKLGMVIRLVQKQKQYLEQYVGNNKEILVGLVRSIYRIK